MPLEVNEIGIVMRVIDGPERVVETRESREQAKERRQEIVDECVRRVLQALKREQEP